MHLKDIRCVVYPVSCTCESDSGVRRSFGNHLKAYIDSAVYIGDDQLEALTNLKSKEELLGELIGLLQSPMSNLMSALQSGGNTIAGILKTLETRGE
jgi:ribosomal protein L10